MVIPDLYDLWLALFWTPKPQSMHRHWYILHPISHWYPMFRYPEYSLNIPYHIISHHITSYHIVHQISTLILGTSVLSWERTRMWRCSSTKIVEDLMNSKPHLLNFFKTDFWLFLFKDFKGWAFKISSFFLAADSGNTKLLARTPPSSDSWGCQLGSANDEKIGKHMETSECPNGILMAQACRWTSEIANSIISSYRTLELLQLLQSWWALFVKASAIRAGLRTRTWQLKGSHSYHTKLL